MKRQIFVESIICKHFYYSIYCELVFMTIITPITQFDWQYSVDIAYFGT